MKATHTGIDTNEALVKVTRCTVYLSTLLIVCFVAIATLPLFVAELPAEAEAATPMIHDIKPASSEKNTTANKWTPPVENALLADTTGKQIKYGKELIAHTALYYGPKGSLAQVTNGMNCQNCHLDGGTRFYGNNYAGFVASYPKLSARAGKMQSVAGRLVECFERSLGGKAPDTTSKEIKAMLAYMRWIGRDVKKGQKLAGAATEKLPFLTVPANPLKGKSVYIQKCQVCHGKDGEGVLTADGRAYTFPPVWGKHSYNDGAGMYRLRNLAGFVKNNMPFGATYKNPQLTDEEAWNVAAFINSQPRAHRDQRNDWKDLSKKPIDFPFGPYADSFSERQHKYGPFGPIKAAQEKLEIKKS